MPYRHLRRAALVAVLFALLLTAPWLPAALAQPTPPPVPTATAGPTPEPTNTPIELVARFIVGDERGKVLVALWQQIDPRVVVALVLGIIIVAFGAPPIIEYGRKRFSLWLEQRDQQRLTREREAERRAALPAAISAYLAGLKVALAKTSIVPLAGTPSDARATQTYVPLRVAPVGSILSEPVLAVLGTKQALLLTGEAGSGKSHTLRYVALMLAEAWPNVPAEVATTLGLGQDASRLPIYVRLQALPRCRDALCEAHPNAPVTFFQLLDYHLGQLFSEVSALLPDLVSALDAAQNEQCLFLLDGLDELDDRELSQLVQAELGKLIQRPEVNHRYVVASRPTDEVLCAAGFRERRLLPLEREQMHQILLGWYRPGFGDNPVADADLLQSFYAEQQAEAQATALLDKIQADADFAPMATRPLFLIALARLNTVNVGLRLPRFKKYELLFELLFKWRRNQLPAAPETDQINPNEIRRWLGHFAACMLDLERDKLSSQVFSQSQYRRTLALTDEQLPDADLLDRELGLVVRHTGLLNDVGGAYSFTFGFREYLAAFAKRGRADLVEQLFTQRTNPYWRTVMLFTVGLQAESDPGPLVGLVQQLLDDGPASTLLAAEALVEAGAERELQRPLRATLEKLTTLAAADPQFAAAAITLLARLTNLQI